MIVAGMQRLVDVTDEVQQKLQRESSLRITGRRALEFCCEFIELVDDAVIGGPQGRESFFGQVRPPMTSGLQIRTVEFQIHEMPVARFAGATMQGISAQAMPNTVAFNQSLGQLE
jgi:hypothetical protein